MTDVQQTRRSHSRILQRSGRRWARAGGVARPSASPRADVAPSRGTASTKGPNEAKIAHLFLVRADLHQEAVWEEFFGGAGRSYSIYVHPKWPDRVTTRLFRDCIISEVCATEYGRVSIVEAELCLLRGDGGGGQPVLSVALRKLRSDPLLCGGISGDRRAGKELARLSSRQPGTLRWSGREGRSGGVFPQGVGVLLPDSAARGNPAQRVRPDRVERRSGPGGTLRTDGPCDARRWGNVRTGT